MRTILITLMLMTPVAANAGFWDFLKEPSLKDKQLSVDAGVGNYEVSDGTNKVEYLFEADLEPGTALPKIKDGRALLREARKTQTVEVAGPWSFAYPVLVEIAKQNKVSVEWLIVHLNDNWIGEGSSTGLNELNAVIAEIEVDVPAKWKKQIKELQTWQEEVSKDDEKPTTTTTVVEKEEEEKATPKVERIDGFKSIDDEYDTPQVSITVFVVDGEVKHTIVTPSTGADDLADKVREDLDGLSADEIKDYLG